MWFIIISDNLCILITRTFHRILPSFTFNTTTWSPVRPNTLALCPVWAYCCPVLYPWNFQWPSDLSLVILLFSIFVPWQLPQVTLVFHLCTASATQKSHQNWNCAERVSSYAQWFRHWWRCREEKLLVCCSSPFVGFLF